MAELMVGGAILGAFLNVLLDRMATPEFLNLLTAGKMDKILLQKLKTNLTTVNAVLHDAEYRQVALRDASVKHFLDDLRGAAYDTDDLLDLIAYKITAAEIQADQRASVGNWSWNLSSLLKSLSMKASDINHSEQISIPSSVTKKIEENVEILEILVKQIDPLDLKKKNRKDALPQRQPTSPVVEESEIFGRNDEKDALLKSLKAVGKNGIGVIPIVGMGGIGKTTLARLLYNDTEVKELFSIRAWVCVSDNYDGSKIKKELFQQINISTKCDNLSPQQIDEEIKKSLEGKKYLIVLDDIWKIGYDNWNNLLEHLKSGANESKIIVTTRIEDTSKMVRTDGEHLLNKLTDDSCWQLFKKHAFINGEWDENVRSLREKIMSKCGGLPLAAKMLGGVMRGKQMAECEEILKSEMWKIDCGVIPALMLSYQYLPSHLKQCFAYCAIFPQDYKIRKEELIQLWAAECFIVKSRGERKSLKKLGDEYFQELLSRYFFQEHNDQNEGSYFLMHDLINDLALLISGDFLVRMDEGNSCKLSTRNRYFSFMITSTNCDDMIGSIPKARHLRTFWSFSQKHELLVKELEMIVDEVSNVLRCLRVLSFRNFSFVKLPKSIKHLKHLRYLNLQNTLIKRLPKVVCSLYNLQTLILYRCWKLVELPKNIQSLINLQSLDIRATASLKKMPPGLGNLKDLRILSKFIVGKEKGSDIDELVELQHLCGELQICDLQNVAEIPKEILKNKKHLEDLRLEWTHMSDNKVLNWELSNFEEIVLERLQPCVNIIKLSIFGYGGNKLPDWIGDSSYSNIVSLELNGCKHCTFLPTFDKLSSLKHLSISNCDAVIKLSRRGELLQPLMSLASLKISHCKSLIHFPKGGISAPNMSYLELVDCENLESLPENMNVLLSSLQYLKIVGCEQLESFPKEGLPVNLQSLEIVNCDNLDCLPLPLTFDVKTETQSSQQEGFLPNLKFLHIQHCNKLIGGLRQWGLQRFNTLSRLSLVDYTGDDLGSFPEELLLPSSLTFLKFETFKNLEGLNYKGLQHLSFLSQLEIVGCYNLQSLPELQHLTSLARLIIWDCYKLRCLAEEGLPSSLSYLKIRSCPLLVQRCEQYKGEDWPKISHISTIDISK